MDHNVHTKCIDGGHIPIGWPKKNGKNVENYDIAKNTSTNPWAFC